MNMKLEGNRPCFRCRIAPDAITNCSEDFRDSIHFRPHKTAEFTSSMPVLTSRGEVRGLSIVWRFPLASCIRRKFSEFTARETMLITHHVRL